MSMKSKRISTIISLFLVFAVSQVYIAVSVAGPGPATARGESSIVTPQQPTAVLTTEGGKPITVNGVTAISGATIVTGASIETPNGVDATVTLGSLGSLKIEPNTKLTLEFQPGSVTVTLIEGCVTLRTKKGTTGEVISPKGGGGKTDPAKDGVIRTCPDRPAAVAAAGAGGLLGLGAAATAVVIGGGAAAFILPFVLGRNPSPSRP